MRRRAGGSGPSGALALSAWREAGRALGPSWRELRLLCGPAVASGAAGPGAEESWADEVWAAGLGRGKEKERPAGKEGWVGFSHGLGCFGFGLALGFGLLFYF